jgi:hypothetical protein
MCQFLNVTCADWPIKSIINRRNPTSSVLLGRTRSARPVTIVVAARRIGLLRRGTVHRRCLPRRRHVSPLWRRAICRRRINRCVNRVSGEPPNESGGVGVVPSTPCRSAARKGSHENKGRQRQRDRQASLHGLMEAVSRMKEITGHRKDRCR